MKQYFYIIVILTVGLFGCSQTSTNEINLRYVYPQEEVIRKGDSVAFVFHIDTIAPENFAVHDELLGVDSIRFSIINGDNKTIPVKFFNFSYLFGKDSLRTQLIIKTDFFQPGESFSHPDEDIDDIELSIMIYSGIEKMIIKDLFKDIMMRKMLSSKINHIALYPNIIKSNDNITFKLLAIKLNPMPNSYLPNSEFFRTQVFKNGKQVWNSSQGANYLMAIYDVKPDSLGAYVEFTRLWDGEDEKGKSIHEGKYDVILTLPIKPQPIVCKTSFYYRK